MPSDPFATLDSRIERLTKAIETLTARTGPTFNGGIDPSILADAVAQGMNQATAIGARTAAFGHPLPSASEALRVPGGPLPTPPGVKAHRYQFQGQGHQVIAGVIGGKLRRRAETQIQQITGGILGAGESLGPLVNKVDPHGNPYSYHDILNHKGEATGRTVAKTTVEAAQQKIKGVHNRTGLASTVLQGVGSGEGVKGILSGIGMGESGLAEIAPYAAIGVAGAEVVKKAAQMTAATRQQLAGYQQAYGGSEGSQFGQLFHQGTFGLSEMFGIGGKQANQLFQGVSGLGLNGADRQNGINFGLDMFYKTGMSVAHSLEIMRVAAQNGNKELHGLTNAIMHVTNAARQAGVPVGAAQQNFTQIYSSTAPTLGGGAGTAYLAGQAATAQANMGRLGQNLDTSGLFSYNTISQVAGMNNTNPEALMAQANSPGAGANKVANMTQSMIWQRLQPYMSRYIPFIRDYLQKLAAAGVKQSDMKRSDYLMQLTNQIMTMDSQQTNGALYQSIQSVASTLGVSGDPISVVGWAVSVAVGQIAPTMGFNVAGSTSTPMPFGKNTKSLIGQMVGQLNQNGKVAFGAHGDKGGGGPINQEYAQGTMGDILKSIGVGTGEGNYLTKGSVAEDYLQYLQSNGGKRDASLEEAIKDRKLRGSKFIVKDPSGKNGEKVVDLQDLMTKYPSQIHKALIKGGAYAGQTIDYATGASQSSNTPGTPGGKGKNVGTIQIQLTPQAAQLIRVSSPDGINIATSNAQNIPPSQYPIQPTGAQYGNQ